MITHGSLFSGIGGFDLASEMMGWKNVFHCENNTFCQQVLKYYWPDSDSLDDIIKTDFKKYKNAITIISGGFPCQPFSLAGKQKGKTDERYLWGEMFRAIQEIQPKYVVAENVVGLLTVDGGLSFEQINVDLENEGYQIQSFIIPACSKNAPHIRKRIFIIGIRNTANPKCRRGIQRGKNIQKGQITRGNVPINNGRFRYVANPNGNRLQTGVQSGNDDKQRGNKQGTFIKKFADSIGAIQNGWQNFPTQSPICNGNDGIPRKMVGITFSKWRNESLKALGNAVVPDLIIEIFKAIEKIHYGYDEIE